jgi:hypothetical protein
MKIRTGIYKHYKGGLYKVIDTATHSETLEDMVIYAPVQKEGLWVRPLAMFFEKVDVNGNSVDRFSYIGDALPNNVNTKDANNG